MVLVHKNAAGLAQDVLCSHGILWCWMLNRMYLNDFRDAYSDTANSIESSIGRPTLGVCDTFYIKECDDGDGGSKP